MYVTRLEITDHCNPINRHTGGPVKVGDDSNDYRFLAYTFSINAYHIHCNGEYLRGTGSECYEARKERWLDDKHKRVTDALKELEAALLDLAKYEGVKGN